MTTITVEQIVGAVTTKLGIQSESPLQAAPWDVVLQDHALVQQISTELYALLEQVLFYEGGKHLKATKPIFQQYLRQSIHYQLGLLDADELTDDDVGTLKINYQQFRDSYLKEDRSGRIRRVEAAVRKAIDVRDSGPNEGKVSGAVTVPLARRPVGEAGAESASPIGSIPDEEPRDELPPAKPSWEYRPLPVGLDPHEEFDARQAPGTPGYTIIGARARGKKHKHEGTHCDDWFEFTTVGEWNLIAVSDGAGSRKFSRVGAKAACQAAVRTMAGLLKNVSITIGSRTELPEFFARKPNGSFEATEVESVQHALHGGMEAAYAAVEAEYRTRSSGSQALDYIAELARDIELADLSCTLLLAAHSSFKHKNKDYSLVLACQIGDGMTAAVFDGGTTSVLGIADSGAFSGETEFLTSKGKPELEALRSRTHVSVGPLNALMVMTDGVADDYFPNETEAARLFADLMLVGIVPGPKRPRLVGPDLKLVERAEAVDYVDRVPTVSEAPAELPIASTQKLAEGLKITVADLVAKPGVLSALARPISDATPPQERLRQWIDAYQVRGSFDDRTLVVLYREELG
jgi:hypothetical protein